MAKGWSLVFMKILALTHVLVTLELSTTFRWMHRHSLTGALTMWSWMDATRCPASLMTVRKFSVWWIQNIQCYFHILWCCCVLLYKNNMGDSWLHILSEIQDDKISPTCLGQVDFLGGQVVLGSLWQIFQHSLCALQSLQWLTICRPLQSL